MIRICIRLAAITTIVILLFSINSAVVQAHFTLGDLTGTFRYHANDFDPHVPGVVGYVWPGGGQNTWGGSPNFANVNNAPGYQSPYPGGKPSNVPGTNQIGNALDNPWYQLEGNSYSPFGSVLTGSTGDLIFAINATAGTCPGGVAEQRGLCSANPNHRLGWSGVTIFIPSGFTLPTMDGSNIVTTITDSYSNIQVWKVSPYDRYSPGWTAVNIWVDGIQNAVKNGGSSYYDHQYINFTSAGEWYYFRINDVAAPTVAGRYFFKILLQGDSNYLAGPEGTSGNATASFPIGLTLIDEFPFFLITIGEAPTQFIPTENWPVLLVKGEIDPAIITGTIRYAGYNQTLYSQPVQEAGRVYAKMTTRLDPYTGQQRPDLPLVDAVGYFNATAQGHYEVEGVAPGIYDLYAEAAGYPETLIQSGFTVLRGQSLHFDGYLQPGPVIHGNVYSKHQFGDEPWPLKPSGGVFPPGQSKSLTDIGPNTYIKIEFYDAPTLSNIPDPKAGLVSWSPLPCVAGGQDEFYPKGSAVPCDDPTWGSQIAFPWHEYIPKNGYLVQQVSKAGSLLPLISANELLTQDPEGVGPPQNWFVQGGTTIPFHYEFGVKGEYGAPRDLDGMVPQVYATWVNGLTPGRYYVRAWVFRYVQSELDGSTFQEYYFDVTPNEWAGDVTLPIDLRLSSWVNLTVHFHDQINNLIEDPINTGGGFMAGYLMGADGNVYSYNQTALGINCLSTTEPATVCATAIRLTGPGVYYAQKGGGNGWFEPNPLYGGFTTIAHGFGFGHSPLTGANLDSFGVNGNAVQEGRANIQFWGIDKTWSGEDYGIPSGTYSPFTYVLGYVTQGVPDQVSVTLSGNPTSVSDHMIRGPGFNVTLFSVDWERPIANRNWEFGNPEGWTFREDTRLWGSDISGNSRTGFINSNSVGLGIDLGAYMNGTLSDWIGEDQAVVMASSIGTTNLFQNQFESNTTLNGGGFDIITPSGDMFSANQTWFGSEICATGYTGGWLGPAITFGAQPFLSAGPFHNMNSLFIFPHILLPTAFKPGEYTFGAFTYGYVQNQLSSVYADVGQIADVRINLVIGVNITLDILFKKEHIITPTSANMSGRVRIFNDQGQLVGEWMSSEGTYAVSNGYSRAADGTTQYPFGPLRASIPQPLPLNAYNFVPGGTNLLHVVIAGLPQVPAGKRNAPTTLPAGFSQGDPVFTPYACAFYLACYSGRLGLNFRTGQIGIIPPETPMPGNVVGYPFPDTGILGAPDYQGGWTVEADFVPWYANNTSTMELASGGFQTPTQDSTFAQYYSPVSGLLMGESYHIIPGTTATSGISLTEDAAQSSTFLYHSMAANHLGPYSQNGVWQISNAHLSGEASGIFEVDLNGLVTGNAFAFTWNNEFRPLSWDLVTVTGAPGTAGSPWNFYTYDGMYEAYLTPGTYQFTISSPGLTSQTFSVAVSSGQSGAGYNMYLQPSNIPVPEFSGIIIAGISALAASLYVLRRRRVQ
jgi:hypothetical protein